MFTMQRSSRLTVTSPDGIDGVELVLEPLAFEPARIYRKALYDAGISPTAFITNKVIADFEHQSKRGMVFRGEPVSMGPITAVLFENTCGNLVNLVQPMA